MDSRQRVLADRDEGIGTTAVAVKYRVTPDWVRRLKQRRKATGETAPRLAGRRRTTWMPHAKAIRAAITQTPDATLAELRQRLGRAFRPATLHRAITVLGLTGKKVERAAERDRPRRRGPANRGGGGPAGARRGPAEVRRRDLGEHQDGPAHGRNSRGQGLVGTAPHGHRKTTTFVAALCLAGLVAPMVVDGAINGDLFLADVEQQLVPTLRPGDIVIMDNLSSHERPRVREAIEEAGCRLLLLPPDSPGLNPIELAFSRLKALLRKAGNRTVEGLWGFLGQAVDAFSPQECRNFLKRGGYDPAAVCGHNAAPD